MVKPHGFVLDFVGIFDKLEKALAFDSDEINAIVKDLGAAEGALQERRWRRKAPAYLALGDAELQRQGRGQPDRALPRQGAAQGVLQGIQGDRDALRDHLARCVPAAVHRRLRDAVRHLRGGAQRLRADGCMSTGRSRRRPTSWCSSTSAPIDCRARRRSIVAIDRRTIETIKQRDEGEGDEGHQPDQEHREDGRGEER